MQVFKVILIGRTNVGKSTLFNALINKRYSIEHSNAGSTRDQIEHILFTGNNCKIMISDIGGYTKSPKSEFDLLINENIYKTLQKSNLGIFVFDLSTDLTEDDIYILDMLRKKQIKTIYVGNKADKGNFYEHDFVKYGIYFENIISVSAVHRSGIFDLVSKILSMLHISQDDITLNSIPQIQKDSSCKIIVVGKPNTGKSTFINTLHGDNRLICSKIRGTTRDVVPIEIIYNTNPTSIIVLDTPGIVKQMPNTLDGSNCKLFQERALLEITKASVCIVMFEVKTQISQLEKNLCKTCLKHNKPLIICLNKIDLLDHRSIEFDKNISKQFGVDVPVCYVSAKSGEGINNVLAKALDLFKKNNQQLMTSKLNKLFHDVWRKWALQSTASNTTPIGVKPMYIVQTGYSPLRFKFFMNTNLPLSTANKNTLIKLFKKTFGFCDIPVVIRFESKSYKFKH